MPKIDEYLTKVELSELKRLYWKYCKTFDWDDFHHFSHTREEILNDIMQLEGDA